MGTIPSFKIEEHMKEKLASEEEEMNTVIKPEYMKNTAMEHVSCPMQVSERVCAH